MSSIKSHYKKYNLHASSSAFFCASQHQSIEKQWKGMCVSNPLFVFYAFIILPKLKRKGQIQLERAFGDNKRKDHLAGHSFLKLGHSSTSRLPFSFILHLLSSERIYQVSKATSTKQEKTNRCLAYHTPLALTFTCSLGNFKTQILKTKTNKRREGSSLVTTRISEQTTRYPIQTRLPPTHDTQQLSQHACQICQNDRLIS